MIMSTSVVFQALADLFQWTFQLFEIVGNSFNYAVIVLGFIGLFYWLNYQAKFNKQAKNNPNQIK